MIKPVGGSFEELEQIPRQVAKGIVSLPAQIVTKALKPGAGEKKIDPLTGIEIPSQKKVKKLKKQEARKQAAIPHAQQIIYGLKPKPSEATRPNDLPAYIGGKPGMTEEKLAERQGLKKPKQELPVPVMAAKRQFSTHERKLGVSG